MQYIIDLGKQLVNSLKYIEKRTNMKVKTSFLNLFVFDDIYTLDSIPEVLIFLAGAPKGLYDAKTDDKEKEIKKLCYQYYQTIYNLPLNIKEMLKYNKLWEYLQPEPKEEPKIGIRYAISNEKYKRHCEILKQVIEEIEWNNSVLQGKNRRRIWMKYYKLSMDMERENDIICHFQNDYGIQQNALNTGKVFENWDDRFEFFYTKEEGDVWTDYLVNDKGWFLVSNRLKTLLESVNTDIQFLKVGIKETNNGEDFKQYYIANIIKVVDALCLDKSEYFETEIEGIGTIYTVSKYGIYADKTDSADVFKLSNRQEIPIFVSEKFKDLIQKVNITGISLTEISVV